MLEIATRTTAATPEGAVAPRLRRGTAAAWALCLGVAMWAPLLIATWGGFRGTLLMLVPAALAILAWQTSVLAACYLAQVTAYFGVTSWLMDGTATDLAVSTVLSWSLAIAAGALMSAALPVRHHAARQEGSHPTWPHVTVVGALQFIQAYLVLTQQSGYSAQINLGRLNPTGLLGILSAAAPVLTLTLLFACLVTRRHERLAIGLTVLQAGILTASGLRGASVVFMLAVLVGSLIVVPADSPWRRRRRMALVGLSTLVLVATMFTLAAVVKSEAAEAAGLSSSGTQLVETDTVVETVARRLDLSSYLDTGLRFRGNDAALDAVALSNQVVVAIPRALWPDKPEGDYGQRVAAIFYGSTSGKTSSTITTVGDTALNLGWGLPLAGLLLGLVLCRLEGRVRQRATTGALVTTAVLAYRVVGQESPVVIIGANALRDFLVVICIWLACDAVAKRSSRSRSQSNHSLKM